MILYIRIKNAFSQERTKKMLGTNKLSAFVANKLSGYYDSQKGGFHDLGTHTTGDTDNEIQTSLYRVEKKNDDTAAGC